MSTASDIGVLGLGLVVDILGGVAVTVQAAPTGTSNTKAIGATSCVRKDLRRAVEDGLDRDTCTFLIPVAQFVTGFSASNPVTAVAGMTLTVTGESVWYVQDVESSDAMVALRCVGA